MNHQAMIHHHLHHDGPDHWAGPERHWPWSTPSFPPSSPPWASWPLTRTRTPSPRPQTATLRARARDKGQGGEMALLWSQYLWVNRCVWKFHLKFQLLGNRGDRNFFAALSAPLSRLPVQTCKYGESNTNTDDNTNTNRWRIQYFQELWDIQLSWKEPTKLWWLRDHLVTSDNIINSSWCIIHLPAYAIPPLSSYVRDQKSGLGGDWCMGHMAWAPQRDVKDNVFWQGLQLEVGAPWLPVKNIKNRSLGALRAPTSRLRTFGPFGPAW